MSGTANTTSNPKKTWIRKAAKLGLFMLVPLLLINHYRILSWVSMDPLRAHRIDMSKAAGKLFTSEIGTLDNDLKNGDHSAVIKSAEKTIAYKADLNGITHPEDIAPVCGGSGMSSTQTYLVLDVGGCTQGTRVMFFQNDPHQSHTFQFNLLRGSKSEPLTSESAIVPIRGDGFNSAKHLGDGRWELKGDLVFIYEGYGNRVEGRFIE